MVRCAVMVYGLLASFLMAVAPAAVQAGHCPYYTFSGDSTNDEFGVSVSGAEDVNNDGFADLIVGADQLGASGNGFARVFSGVDGSILYTFNGDSASDGFGRSVSGAGDVNNDGFADLIVGAFLDDNSGTGSGSGRVFSGIDGSILYTFNGDSAGDQFAYAVSGAGDVNNDGFDDVIVGAIRDDNNGNDSGSARVFSGFDGSVLYTFNGDSANDQFGISVSGAGDVNNDNFDDVIVGADQPFGSGYARVYSGIDGSILYSFVGDSAGDRFGVSVSGAGDVNDDGFADLVVGASFDNLTGSARVFSGADGSTLYTFNGNSSGDAFGISVSGAGDVNNDSFDDLIVGALTDDNHASNSGSARVFSGIDGSILYTFNGDGAGDLLGGSVSGAGDLNNDGLADFIVGATQGIGARGYARLFISVPFLAPPGSPCQGDTNGDGSVDLADLNNVLFNFGLVCPAGG